MKLMDVFMNTVYVKFSRLLFTLYIWRVPNGSTGRNKLLFQGDRVLYGYRGTETFRGTITPILNIYISFRGMTYTLNSALLLPNYVGFWPK